MSPERSETSPENQPFEGSCFCGTASFRVEGEPLISVYCHCTVCQRLNGCVFVHGVHYPKQSFKWTHEDPNVVFSQSNNKSGWHGWRCKFCYTLIAGYNTNDEKWSVKSSHFKRDSDGLIKNWELIKPRAHIFYGTRMFDIHDDLPKWEGYENKSRMMHAGGVNNVKEGTSKDSEVSLV